MARTHKFHLRSKKKFRTFLEMHPQYSSSKPTLNLWRKVVTHANWDCLADVRETFNTASQVGQFVVFNVGGNKFRVIAEILSNFRPKRIYIRYILTHEEYDEDKWK